MTKQEERNILAQIKNLINEAGEDSYIGMAFEGCVQMAHENIDNDWGNSPRASLEVSYVQINDLTKKLENAEATVEILERDLAKAKEKIYPKQLVHDIFSTMCERSQEATNTITRTAELIANYADNPTDIAVIDGLKLIKRATKQRNDAERIMDEIRKYA